MVYVIFTAKAFGELMPSLNQPAILWLNAGVAEPNQVAKLRAEGCDVSTWANRFDPTVADQVASALAMVNEHHPDEILWVEQ